MVGDLGARHDADRVDAAVAAWTGSRDADVAAAELGAAGVPASVVAPTGSAHDNVQFAHRGFLQPLVHAVTGRTGYPGFPMRFSLFGPHLYASPPPLLGEHNAEVLSDARPDGGGDRRSRRRRDHRRPARLGALTATYTRSRTWRRPCPSKALRSSSRSSSVIGTSGPPGSGRHHTGSSTSQRSRAQHALLHLRGLGDRHVAATTRTNLGSHLVPRSGWARRNASRPSDVVGARSELHADHHLVADAAVGHRVGGDEHHVGVAGDDGFDRRRRRSSPRRRGSSRSPRPAK